MKPEALLVIDVQYGFLKRGADAAVPLITELVESWPAEHLYYLRYRNFPGSSFTKHVDWHDCMTSDSANIVKEVYREGCKIFEHYGYAPPPEAISSLKKYKTVGLCGLDTDACVMAATFALWDAEIRPVVLAQYCASSGGPPLHEAALGLMMRQFGAAGVFKEKMRYS